MAHPEFKVETKNGEQVRGLPCLLRAADEAHARRLVAAHGSIDWTPTIIEEDSKAVTDEPNPIELVFTNTRNNGNVEADSNADPTV